MRHWFSTRGETPDAKHAATHRTGPVAAGEATEPAPPSAGSSPLEPQPGGGTEDRMEQSVCGVATEAREANADASAAATGNVGCAKET